MGLLVIVELRFYFYYIQVAIFSKQYLIYQSIIFFDKLYCIYLKLCIVIMISIITLKIVSLLCKDGFIYLLKTRQHSNELISLLVYLLVFSLNLCSSSVVFYFFFSFFIFYQFATGADLLIVTSTPRPSLQCEYNYSIILYLLLYNYFVILYPQLYRQINRNYFFSYIIFHHLFRR